MQIYHEMFVSLLILSPRYHVNSVEFIVSCHLPSVEVIKLQCASPCIYNFCICILFLPLSSPKSNSLSLPQGIPSRPKLVWLLLLQPLFVWNDYKVAYKFHNLDILLFQIKIVLNLSYVTFNSFCVINAIIIPIPFHNAFFCEITKDVNSNFASPSLSPLGFSSDITTAIFPSSSYLCSIPL